MDKIKPVKFCPVPVLPAVYGDALSWGEVIGKMQVTINELIDKVEELEGRIEELEGSEA